MEFAKILRYSNPDNKSPALSIGSEVVFFSFFAMWIVARLLYFPLYAIHAVSIYEELVKHITLTL